MNSKLYKSNKLQLRKSQLHGYGVFATCDIKDGDVLEECPYIKISPNCRESMIYKYMFSWPKHDRGDMKRLNVEYMTIPFGYACMYNCSKDPEKNNIDWICDEARDVYVFNAVRDIAKDSELLIYYGDAYWSTKRTK